MKKTTVKIGGREFCLAFPLSAMLAMEETMPGFDIGKIAEYVRSPSGLLDLITVMATEGEKLEGRVPDVGKDWFGSHIVPSPSRIAKLQIVILDTLTEWLRMETEEDEDLEHDVVLEQIKKKETTGG